MFKRAFNLSSSTFLLLFIIIPSYPPSKLLLQASWYGGYRPRWVVQSRLLFVPYTEDRDWGTQL